MGQCARCRARLGRGRADLGHTLIYDPGPLYSAESNAGQRVVVPYLRYLGISHVDMLIITHSDSDHSRGTASVLSSLQVDAVRSSVGELAESLPACRAVLGMGRGDVQGAASDPSAYEEKPK